MISSRYGVKLLALAAQHVHPQPAVVVGAGNSCHGEETPPAAYLRAEQGRAGLVRAGQVKLGSMNNMLGLEPLLISHNVVVVVNEPSLAEPLSQLTL